MIYILVLNNRLSIVTQQLERRSTMEILTKVKGWAGALTEVGVSLLSLGIILEVLFN